MQKKLGKQSPKIPLTKCQTNQNSWSQKFNV